MRVTLVLAAVLGLGGCTAWAPGFPAPPPLPAETIPLPPVSDQALIWQPGDWTYFDGSYRYEAGRFVPRGDHRAAWTFGHWVGTQGQYRWVPGGWN